jgi:hypothetical protein
LYAGEEDKAVSKQTSQKRTRPPNKRNTLAQDGGVQLVACTRDNVSPSFVLEFLKRIATIIKDYCGSLSEDAIRRNFVLIYELLDEACDYGTPQSTATEALKQFVLNEPTVVAPPVRVAVVVVRVLVGSRLLSCFIFECLFQACKTSPTRSA